MLVAERWAEPHTPRVVKRGFVRASTDNATAIRNAQSVVQRLRQIREQFDRRRFAQVERRRIEDRTREELHDERAITIRRGRAEPD